VAAADPTATTSAVATRLLTGPSFLDATNIEKFASYAANNTR
jgi:hypothetical protein